MTGSRAVRITVVSYDRGMADIFAGGKRVALVLVGFKDWTAYLYPVATDRRARPSGCEEVTGETLGELRRVLRKRVADEGAWWKG